MSSPSVTIITPCYECASSLSTALASLLAQTYTNWECIVVDDGSTQDIEAVIKRAGDERIRFIRLPTNQGRPVARQAALDAARGEFIATLDGDDWYYPDKLERQVHFLQANPEVELVTCGKAIIGEANELLALRRFSAQTLPRRQKYEFFETPSFGYPTAMMRGETAKLLRYDLRLARSEDRDFLMRLLPGKEYVVLPDIAYAYRETFSATRMREALIAFRCQRLIFRKYFKSAPIAARAAYAKTFIKSAVYHAGLATGTGRALFDRRNEPTTAEEVTRFERARDVVLARRREVFGH